MSIWIPVTIAAALFQALRFMLQKHLSTVRLSAAGATFARFAYSAPLIAVLLAVWMGVSQQGWPALNAVFWAFVAIGGLAQIVATIAVVLLFKERNFAVGITLMKTEVIQTVLIGLVVLGDTVSPLGFAIILVGLTAVLLLSKTPDSDRVWWQDLFGRATGLGLSSGFLFGISAVSYRGAALQIEGPEALTRAAITLAAVTSCQMIGMGLWLAWRDRAELVAVWQSRNVASVMGLLSMAGSFCWFYAFALQSAAYVKALGQIELIFSLAASIFVFKERITEREILGMALLAASIIGLVLTV